MLGQFRATRWPWRSGTNLPLIEQTVSGYLRGEGEARRNGRSWSLCPPPASLTMSPATVEAISRCIAHYVANVVARPSGQAPVPGCDRRGVDETVIKFMFAVASACGSNQAQLQTSVRRERDRERASRCPCSSGALFDTGQVGAVGQMLESIVTCRKIKLALPVPDAGLMVRPLGTNEQDTDAHRHTHTHTHLRAVFRCTANRARWNNTLFSGHFPVDLKPVAQRRRVDELSGG